MSTKDHPPCGSRAGSRCRPCPASLRSVLCPKPQDQRVTSDSVYKPEADSQAPAPRSTPTWEKRNDRSKGQSTAAARGSRPKVSCQVEGRQNLLRRAVLIATGRVLGTAGVDMTRRRNGWAWGEPLSVQPTAPSRKVHPDARLKHPHRGYIRSHCRHSRDHRGSGGEC